MRICELCGARYKGTPSTCPLDGGRLRDLPDPLLGRSIGGRYLILEKIGAGGMGTVYRARDDARASDVAIKFLLPELAVDATNRERFLREAKAANRIDHENIIDVHDFGQTDDGQVFLAMEFLQGIALAEEVGRGALGVVRSVDIAMQCASALARAHELDVVHRDIKPENIYLVGTAERPDFVKVLDFGLAHMKGELRLTASGAVFGTPEYMAPEQARGAPLTGLADLYALGCVLFETITGSPPFSGSTPDLILKHLREPAPKASSRVRSVPPDLDALVSKLLEKDPRKRHRDGYHLLEELRRIADRLPMSRPSTAPVSRHDASARAHGGVPRTIVSGAAVSGTGVRADTISLPADSSGAILPERWEQRVTLFRELVPRAYQAQPPPAWLVAAIDALALRVSAARALEGELGRATEQAQEREAHARAVRLRVGRAIDELGRDESRALGRIDDLGIAIASAEQDVIEREDELARTMSELGAIPRTVSIESAGRVRDAGAIASRWLDARARLAAMIRELAMRENERDDLRFQISQLKGRLGTAGAEQELDLTAMRERAAQLGRDREALIDELRLEATRILNHFAGFSSLADAVRAATLPPNVGGRAAAERG